MRLFVVSITFCAAFASAAAAQATFDPLEALVGDWQVFDTVKGKMLEDCETMPQSFRRTFNKYEIDLTVGREPRVVVYRVLEVSSDAIHMTIDDESRTDDAGNPVQWWAIFESRDVFRWWRTDWAPGARTDGEWRRCTPPNIS